MAGEGVTAVPGGFGRLGVLSTAGFRKLGGINVGIAGWYRADGLETVMGVRKEGVPCGIETGAGVPGICCCRFAVVDASDGGPRCCV